MATLWTFGDSFTDFYKPLKSNTRHWRHDYRDWKGYVPKVYGEIIAEKLNMDLVNKGLGGCDNSHILEEFCKVCNQIKKDDIVIFGWTIPARFRLPDKKGSWAHFNRDPRFDDGFYIHGQIKNFNFLSKNTILEILINRLNPTFEIELCNWVKLINLAIKDVKVIHWSWYSYNAVCNIHYINHPYERIEQETNGEVADGHWSEKGHYQFSDFLLNIINTNDKILI